MAQFFVYYQSFTGQLVASGFGLLKSKKDGKDGKNGFIFSWKQLKVFFFSFLFKKIK